MAELYLRKSQHVIGRTVLIKESRSPAHRSFCGCRVILTSETLPKQRGKCTKNRLLFVSCQSQRDCTFYFVLEARKPARIDDPASINTTAIEVGSRNLGSFVGAHHKQSRRNKDNRIMKGTTIFLMVFVIGCASAQEFVRLNCTDCQGLGVCQKNAQCRCFTARLHPTDDDGNLLTWLCTRSEFECVVRSDTLRDLMKERHVGVRVFRGIAGFFSFALTALIAWRLYLEFRFRSEGLMDGQPSVRKVVKFSLAIDLLICFILFMMSALDWWGTFGVIPFGVYNGASLFVDFLFVVLFTGMILHWAELYQVTMRQLRQASMMKKVNSNYQGELTLEQVVNNLTFLQRFKIPFIVITFIAFTVFVGRIVGVHMIITPKAWDTFFPIVETFYCVVWFCYGVAFTIYGIKLCRVMPDLVSSKVKLMTYKMIVILILQITNSIMVAIVDTYTVGRVLERDIVNRILRLSIAFMILEINMPIRRIRSWFGTSLLNTSSSGNSSGSSKETIPRVDIDLTTMKAPNP
ncbi:hypothetical protein PROFUN_03131 [Planoprotostelium fungivorum]|uniref:Transmembrane protein n=1 Tax=Planoprotostelium fungivorum TaxID=1890364 RepID=A0A2P6NQC3_9EUKA|nr:hypothetical protein PROFUN_03131 [Planoprotostelium fungivorum]